jgi:hypothetical protein
MPCHSNFSFTGQKEMLRFAARKTSVFFDFIHMKALQE